MSKELQRILTEFPRRLVLASASPRRQELLSSLGFVFECRPVHADETVPPGLAAQEIPLYLCEMKSMEYPDVLDDDQVLITADTIVWCNGKVYNKPASFEEGKQMLGALSGRMHEVFTAVCLRSNSKQVSFYDEARVYFKELSNEEIEYYLNNYKPYDKAGGYGVQEWIGYIAIDKIEGSFYTVMGLPVQKVYEELLKIAQQC